MITKIVLAQQSGLYEGIAGMGFTLGETWRATKDETGTAARAERRAHAEERAQPVGKGVQWSNTTDVVSGGAGIGLFLLYADGTLHAPAARALADPCRRSPDRLGEPAQGRRPLDDGSDFSAR